MTRALPPHPSLEQLKKQAKDLRKGHRSGALQAAERIRACLPRLSDASADEVLQGDFSLQEAQHVIACEYGCKQWEMLCSVVAADLNLLAGLADVHIQKLLRQIDEEDWTSAMNGAGAIVSERIMSNMSLRVRTSIKEEIEAHPDLAAEDRLEARHKILAKAIEMAVAGEIEWVGEADVAALERAVERGGFDLLAGLDDRGTQTLMREVSQKDLVAALKDAEAPVRERFLHNMSARVRSFLESEMELSKVDAGDVQAVRRRIVLQAGMLAARGRLQWPSGHRPVTAPREPQYSVPESVTDLISRPLDQLNANDMADLWLGIAEQARKEGILSLQPIEEQTVDPFLREALQLTVDGTEPALLRDILESRLEAAIVPQLRTRALMVIEALMAIHSGDNPGVIRHKLGAIYLAESDAMPGDNRTTAPTAAELAEQLRQTPVGKRSFDEIANLLTDLSILARKESIAAFDLLPAALADKCDMPSEVFRGGLEMMLEGSEPEAMIPTLESVMQTRLSELAQAHRMIIEGVLSTQAGKKPVEIVEAVRQVAGRRDHGFHG